MVHLLDLPPEVLHNVYDWLRVIEHEEAEQLAWEDADADSEISSDTATLVSAPRTCDPISRAMLPFTQAYRFHTVTVTKYTQLAALAAALSRTPALGQLVRALVLGKDHVPCGIPDEASSAAAGTIWECFAGVRSARIHRMDAVLDSLIAAAERGAELAALESLEVECGVGAWSDVYSLGRWKQLLKALPNLRSLEVDMHGNSNQTQQRATAALAAGAVLHATVTSLRLTCFNVSPEAALVNFINAFPNLTTLHLDLEAEFAQPDVISQLRLPNLRKLSYQCDVMEEDNATRLAVLDLKHFNRLAEFTLLQYCCASGFRFFLPPSLRHLALGPLSTVPRAALHELITPNSPRHLPDLKHINLDLPLAHEQGVQLAHLSFDDMLAFGIQDRSLMRWTAEVSREGLQQLVAVSEACGVRVTGTCLAALKFGEAHGMQAAMRRE